MDKTTSYIVIGVIILVLVVGGFFLMKGNSSKTTPASPDQEIATSATAPITNVKAGLAGDTAAVKVHDVLIKNMAFSPQTLTINAGDAINWKNKDNSLHSIVSDSGSELISSNLATEGAYYYRFLAPGNYSYHCGVYPAVKGLIIVQ